MKLAGVNTLNKVIADSLRIAKSKAPRTLKQLLTEDVWIPNGPAKNTRFRFDRQPVQELFVDEFDNGDWNEYVYSAPSQSGKTLIGYVAPLLFHTIELQEDYVLGVPFADMASIKWQADVVPVLMASPKLRRFLPTTGSGSKKGKVRDTITLSNGVIINLMGAGASDAGKAGFTARVVGVTEAAGFSTAGGTSKESDPLRQLRARQKSWPDEQQRTYIEGTLTVEQDLPWALKELSSRSKIVAPCPYCGEWIEPNRSHLRGWQKAKSLQEAKDKTHYVCPDCDHKITDDQRPAILRDAKLLHHGQQIGSDGNITGQTQSTRLWFHPGAWHNLFTSIASIGGDEYAARQIEEDTPPRISAERSLCQFVHSVPWVPPKWDDDLELDPRSIASRQQKPLRKGIVPKDTEVLTTGVDLGSRVGWWLTLATRIKTNGDRSRHIVDYGRFDVPSSRMQLKRAIKYALAELWDQLGAGYGIHGKPGTTRHIDQIWYDANWKPEPVLAHVRQLTGVNRMGRHFGAYGRGQQSLQQANYTAPRKTGNEIREIDPNGLYYLEKIAAHKTLAVIWDSSTSKYQLQQALTLPEQEEGSDGVVRPVPGCVTLHAGTGRTHDLLIRHCMSEKFTTVVTPEGEKQKWLKNGANHLLDCFAMAWRSADRVLRNGPPRDAGTVETTDDWYA